MRWAEIIAEAEPVASVAPTKPQTPKSPNSGGIKPLTPKQARARSDRLAKASAKVADTAAANAARMAAARRQQNSI